MGTFCHLLQPAKTQTFPRNWVFVDTEARIKTLPDGKEEHTIRLGVAAYQRAARDEHEAKDDWHRFHTAVEFWDWALEACERDRKLVILAYNMGYDIRILAAFGEMARRGYRQTGIYVAGQVCIVGFKRGKHHITMIDACNYFNGTLEIWGDMLGFPKIHVDFRRVSDKQLFAHCHRDVEILVKLWDTWLAFLTEHNLGGFAPTKAAQAMKAFRYRYMYGPIWVHDNPKVIPLERRGYFGGRVECFHIGQPTGGPFTKVDINSMYPSIMRTTPVPIRLLRWTRNPTVSALRRGIAKYGVVASVTIKTDVPAYPYRHAGKLLFPIGEFNTVLCSPELIHAVKADRVVGVQKVAVYDQDVIFDAYVDDLYALRLQYKDAGNRIWEQLIKYLLNSLYGKWGQKDHIWRDEGKVVGAEDGNHTVHNLDTGQVEHYRIVAGQKWVEEGTRESRDSCPAISATITSAARIQLWGLIETAGRQNVFYTDTDSLIVNPAGLRRLRDEIDPTKLGALKVEETTTELELFGAKDYRFGDVTKTKGLPKSARPVGERTFQYQQWQGLRGAIGAGNLDRVILSPTVKLLERRYDKGYVSSSGSVEPLKLAASKARSAAL